MCSVNVVDRISCLALCSFLERIGVTLATLVTLIAVKLYQLYKQLKFIIINYYYY